MTRQALISHALCFTLAMNPLLAPLSWAEKNKNQVSPEEQKQAQEEFQTLWNQYLRLLDGDVVEGQFPMDHYSLLPQKVHRKVVWRKNYDEYVAVKLDRFVNWWDLKLEVFSDKKSVQQISFKNASHFKPAQKDKSHHSCPQGNVCTFSLKQTLTKKQLAKKKNKKQIREELNEFALSAKSIAVFGAYVLFIKKGSYNKKTKTQKISFIDLERYNHMIGNEELPVFDVPIQTEKPLEQLEVKDGFVSLGGKKAIFPKQLEVLSGAYDMAFQLEANSLNPQLLASNFDMMNSIKNFLEKAQLNKGSRMNKSSKEAMGLKDFEMAMIDINQVQKRVSTQLQMKKKLGEQVSGKISADMVAEEMVKTEAFNKTIRRVQNKLQKGRTLQVQFSKLIKGLASPRPLASTRIKSAIAAVMAGGQRSLGKPFAVVLDQVLRRKWVTAGTLSYVAFAYILPEAWSTLNALGIDVGQSFLTHIGDAIKGMSQAFWRSFTEVTSSLSPLTTYNTYIPDGEWKKLSIGLGVLGVSLLGILGGYHALQNIYSVFKESRSKNWKGLVERQQRVERVYLQKLGEAEAEERGLDVKHEWEEDLEREIDKILLKRKKEDAAPGMVSHALSLTSSLPLAFGLPTIKETFVALKDLTLQAMGSMKQDIQASGKKLVSKKSEKSEQDEIDTFWKAFRHLFVSYTSYSKTVFHYTGFWNVYSGFRYSSMRWKYIKAGQLSIPYMTPTPVLFLSRFLYPKMFTSVVRDKVLPSGLNQGTQPIWSSTQDKLRQWMRFRKFRGSSRSATVQRRTLLLQQRALDKARKKVVSVENEVVKLSYHSALKATVDFIENEKELVRLVSSGRTSSVSDKGVRNLNFKNKVFLRTYFDQVYQESIVRLLSPVVKKEIQRAQDLEKQSEGAPQYTEALQQILKDKYISPKSYSDLEKHFAAIDWRQREEVLDISADDIEKIVAEVVKEKHEELLQKGAQAANKIIPSIKTIVTHWKHEISGEFDPAQEGSMERYGVVQENRKKPLALARAMRAELSKLLVTLPLDISFYLVMTAGITEGIMKPLQETFWGPNSIGYLSQYNFYGGIASGLAMGLLADSWVKLQEDDRQASLGNFGKVPRGKDAEKSYLQWFWKMTNQRDNSLWENWKFSNKIIWNNVPSYFINMLIFEMIFLTFFDFDVWAVGLALGFLVPNTPFYFKVEQGFEKSAYYDAKDFTDEMLLHPKVQKYLQNKSQKRRNKFNLLFDIVRNLDGLVLKNMLVTPAGEYANRAFSRALFGGDILAEKLISATQNLEEATKTVPGIGSIAGGLNNLCEAIFAHKDVINTPKSVND